MVINLSLQSSKFIRHNDIIVIPEEKVELEFITSCYSIGEILVSVRNGSAEKQFKLRDKPIDITDLCTVPGQVDITAQLLVRDNVAKVWQIEPLCVKEISGGYEVIPEIENLKAQLATANQAIAELAKLVKENETM